jgi:hypothetical protein
MTTDEAGERLARRVHVALLALTAAGIAVWLWRVYGFEPLRIVEPAAR